MTPHTRNTCYAALKWVAFILILAWLAAGCSAPRRGCKSTWDKVGY